VVVVVVVVVDDDDGDERAMRQWRKSLPISAYCVWVSSGIW